MYTQKRMQAVIISVCFHNMILLLKIVTPITETFNNSKNFSIIDLVFSFCINNILQKVSHNFPL